MITKTERNAEIAQRHIAGETLTEIARDIGISRERVRQIVRRAGVSTEVTEEIIKHRYQQEWTCSRCGATGQTKRSEARRRKFCGRKCFNQNQRNTEEDRQRMLNALVRVALQVGHTPTTGEVNLFAGASRTTYTKNFGSLRNAQKLAGLVPNTPGRAPSPLPEGWR